MKNIVYFDLETQKSADEVGGWQNKHLMRVSVAVLGRGFDEDFQVYREEQMDQLVGDLQEFDLIVGFNVKVEPGAQRLAEATSIDIRIYSVIYNVIEDVQKALTGMLEPKFVDFTKATRTNISQVLVTGPGAPAIASEEDLSGTDITAALAQLTADGFRYIIVHHDNGQVPDAFAAYFTVKPRYADTQLSMFAVADLSAASMCP